MDIQTKFPSYKLMKSGFETIADDYTGIFVAAGVRDESDIARAMVKKFPHLTYETALQAVQAITNYSADLIAENAIRINHGDYSFAPAIAGSVPYADSELGPDNSVYVDVICSSRLTEALQDMNLVHADDNVANFTFDKVYDVTKNEMGVATPGGEVKLRGDRMSVGSEGEALKVIDSAGTVFEIEDVEDVGRGSALKFTLPRTAAPGKGSFALTSRGLFTPDAKPETVKRLAEILPPLPLPPGPTIHLWMLNGKEEDVATMQTTITPAEEDLPFSAWFDTLNGEPTLHITPDDKVTWWFEHGGERYEGEMTGANGGLLNKGDDELMMYIKPPTAQIPQVGDVVHYHAELHGGEEGSAAQVFDFTSTVVPA